MKKNGCRTNWWPWILLIGFASLLCLVSTDNSCLAQTQIVTPNQVTVAWDVVTTDVDGDPIDPADVSYQVYIVPLGMDKTVEANWQHVGDTVATTMLIAFTVKGKYWIGVRAVHLVIPGGMTWSEMDVPYTSPGPFFVHYAKGGAQPEGLRTP